jgi:hypothetical protein
MTHATNMIATRADYDALTALNQSLAKELLRSPAHARVYLDAPREETKALRFGTYVHTAILEPDTLNDRYATAPDCDRRTKEGKAAFAEFQTLHAGKTILDPEDTACGLLMAANVRLRLADAGIAFGQTELMLAADYNGVPLKSAIDGVGADGYLYDIKTTEDASPAGMLKAIRAYRYNLQAYFYRLVFELATGQRPRGFRFVFVEKEPPFAVSICEVGPELMSWAIADFEKAVALYRDCTASGVWPAYPDDIQVIDVKATTVAQPITFA